MRAAFAAALLLLGRGGDGDGGHRAQLHPPQEAHQHRPQKTAPRPLSAVVQWHTEDSLIFDAARTTHDRAAVSATAAAAAEVTDVQVVGFGAPTLLGPVRFPNATVPPNESKTDLFFTPDGVHVFGHAQTGAGHAAVTLTALACVGLSTAMDR
jgi:hypothetical protein